MYSSTGDSKYDFVIYMCHIYKSKVKKQYKLKKLIKIIIYLMSHNNETISVNTETGEFHQKFIKAKEEFTKFCISFFYNFVVHSLELTYITHDYSFDKEVEIELFIKFYNNYSYIQDEYHAECRYCKFYSLEEVYDNLNNKIFLIIFNKFKKFVFNGYKTNGIKVYLHHDFLGKYRKSFFNLFNPKFDRNFNMNGVNTDYIFTIESRKDIEIVNESSFIKKSCLLKKLKQILIDIKFDDYLLTKKHIIPKETFKIRRCLLHTLSLSYYNEFSIPLVIKPINPKFSKLSDKLGCLYASCSDNVFNNYSICQSEIYMKNLWKIIPHSLRITISNINFTNINVKQFLLYSLDKSNLINKNININEYMKLYLLKDKEYARYYTLPLLETLVYNKIHKDNEKALNKKNKSVLPIELFELIISFI